MENIMNDKKQCNHPSWRDAPGGKVQCELCGTVGVELRYLKPDDATEQASQPQWIPVSEKMPANGEKVLIAGWVYEVPSNGRFYDVAVYEGGVWWESQGEVEFYEPTHWMPLPAAPENAI